MLYEFEVVSTDRKEMWDRELQAEMQGRASLDFYNSEDTINKYVLDITRVQGFRETRVHFNEDQLPSTLCELEDGYFTPALLITYEEFKKLFEETLKVKIEKATKV